MLRVAIWLAYQQLTYRKAKLVGALSGVSMALILMFTQLGFQGALYDCLISTPRSFDADIILTSKYFWTMSAQWPWMPRRVLDQARGVEGVASVAPLYATLFQLSYPPNGHPLSVWLFAFPPNSPVFLQEDIKRQIDSIRLPDTLLIDRVSRNLLALIQAEVQKTGRVELPMLSIVHPVQPVLKLVGTFQMGSPLSADSNFITSDLNYNHLFSAPLDRVSFGIVRVTKGAEPDVVRRAIEQRLGGEARVFLKEAFIQNEIRYYSTETPIGIIFNAGVLIGFIVGTVFISQVLHGIVNDHIREYATLRAMGYKQVFFLMLVGIIALAIAILCYIPSALISLVIFNLTTTATQLPVQMKAVYMIKVFLLVITMGLVAALLSTKKLKQADPVDLF